MVVKEIGEEGQSIFEFLLSLPLLIGLTVTLVRMNTAIQISIVDQQYARAEALFLTFNSAFYPEIQNQLFMIENSTNQMVLGVSDNAAPETGRYVPKATIQQVTRSKRIQGSNAPGEEPLSRSLVRVRNTVTLCAPTVVLGGNAGNPVLRLASSRPYLAIGASQLTQGVKLNDFCGSPMKYAE